MTAMFDQAAHTRRRLDVHQVVSTRLAALADQDLEVLLERAAPLGTGIGGASALLEFDGVQVYVKKVPLTDIERSPRNANSTANVFELPLFYQYGIGSTGFGAWRELAANLMATDWALAGECVNFPLLHHWRVLPKATPPPSPEQEARLERAVAFWDGSPAIRARREAIRDARASLVLFLEYFPETLNTWLTGVMAAGGEAALSAVVKVDDQLNAVAAFINARGMLHFDLHFHNILTDGEQLYVTDFGMATCAEFDLSPAERDFFARHQLYDRAYLANYLVKWIDDLNEPASPPPGVAALIEPYRPVAAVMGEFIEKLRAESKLTPYPADALECALPDPLRGQPSLS